MPVTGDFLLFREHDFIGPFDFTLGDSREGFDHDGDLDGAGGADAFVGVERVGFAGIERAVETSAIEAKLAGKALQLLHVQRRLILQQHFHVFPIFPLFACGFRRFRCLKRLRMLTEREVPRDESHLVAALFHQAFECRVNRGTAWTLIIREGDDRNRCFCIAQRRLIVG